MRGKGEGGPKTKATSMRICSECGEKKNTADFQATIDGKTCRLAICFDCRAEQSKRFHRERKRRRMEAKV
jgi:protein-arginine kinase activator protein McsA